MVLLKKRVKTYMYLQYHVWFHNVGLDIICSTYKHVLLSTLLTSFERKLDRFRNAYHILKVKVRIKADSILRQSLLC